MAAAAQQGIGAGVQRLNEHRIGVRNVSTAKTETARNGRRSPAAVMFAAVQQENFIRALILAALVAGFAFLTEGLTISSGNISNILIQCAIRGICACGQALVVLVAGLDLSVSGVVAVALMFGGSLITANPHYSLLGAPLSPWMVIPVMLLIGVAFGLANGALVSRFRLPSLVVTLGTWQIGLGLAYGITGTGYVDQIPESIAFFGQGAVLDVPMPVLILFAIVVVTHLVLRNTTFGNEIYAVGGNPRSAYFSGVKIDNVKLAVFAIAGLLYAVAAVIAMSRYLSSTLAQAGGLELSTISAVAIGGVSLSGGRGTIFGVLLGTLIIGVIDDGLSVMGVGSAYTAISKGIIIVAAVILDNLRQR